MILKHLTVGLADGRNYPIYIGKQLLADPKYIQTHLCGRQACIVSNEIVAPLYQHRIETALNPEYQTDSVILPDGEIHKNLNTLAQIYDGLLHNKHNRTTTLIALGGGVIGDMTGYAAASYQRGVNYIQVPTTLLSQVDSSVGGKTGVNHPLGKNMIGAFYQPQCVIIDISTLVTLPKRELSSGIAEIIKYGLICDKNFYQWLESNLDALYALDPETVAESVARSCQNKSQIVSQDERESGIRAILNFGHTFGHAIETAQGYGVWLHGEAVAAGMVVALELSSRLGWVSSKEIERLKTLLHRVRLPTTLPLDMSTDQFLSLMSVDKKVIDGRLRLVLLKGIGEAVVSSDVPIEKIRDALRACRY
ncbi:MAG: 3-dehydroquinate synthase [Cellvibrionaceae bacterium]|jgi:3-dehydroquinate synthase